MFEDRRRDQGPTETNPFNPPVQADIPKGKGLGKTYWLSLLGFAAFAILIAAAVDWVVGIAGMVTSVFAIFHGLVYQNRVMQRALAGQTVTSIHELGLSACSLLLGAAGTVAGAIAFVATCFPAGFLLVDIHPKTGGTRGDSFLPVLSGVCALFAVVLAGWLISWFVPRRPSK